MIVIIKKRLRYCLRKLLQMELLKRLILFLTEKEALNYKPFIWKKVITKKKFAKTLLLNQSAAHTPKARVGQTSTNSITQSTSKSNTSNNNFSSQSDSDYISAVQSGDMATAQKMVDEAAERAFKNSKIRDENGNVIPLSERFNEEREDIRYQDRFDEYDNLFDMGEDLFEDDSKREIFDEMIEKYPYEALYIIKHAAEQTVENFLTKKNRCVALSACTAVLYSNLRCSVFHLLAQERRRGLRELYLGGGGDFYAVAAEHYHSSHNVA